MGFAAVAGHVILFVALLSAGVMLASAINNSLSGQIDARSGYVDRVRLASTEDVELASSGYASATDRTYANFTNNGSDEIEFDELTLLVAGTVTDDADVDRFRVRDHAGSEVWLPGETLEVRTEGRGDVDIALAAPQGTLEYRRN